MASETCASTRDLPYMETCASTRDVSSSAQGACLQKNAFAPQMVAFTASQLRAGDQQNVDVRATLRVWPGVARRAVDGCAFFGDHTTGGHDTLCTMTYPSAPCYYPPAHLSPHSACAASQPVAQDQSVTQRVRCGPPRASRRSGASCLPSVRQDRAGGNEE